jgi:uncharacterized protein
MNRSHYRAWRFRYPELDAPLARSGLQYTAQGSIDMVECNDSVRQAVLLLLATRPGERVMRPDYGCDLYKLLFAPNDDTTAGLAIHYVRKALLRWEPRIDVIRLDAGCDPHLPERLNVALQYRVRANRQIELMTFSLDLNGGES